MGFYDPHGKIRKHLEFIQYPMEDGKKTKKYQVRNVVFGERIGIIHWRGGWHQYVFRAEPEIDMSRSCHKEIDDFIDQLMKEWRESKRKI